MPLMHLLKLYTVVFDIEAYNTFDGFTQLARVIS